MYLRQVYKEWRLLFWVIIAGITGQLFFMYKGIENTPFFLYYMFSAADPVKDSVNVILIKTPDGFYNTNNLSGREKELLMNNIDLYLAGSKTNFEDPLNETIEKRFKEKVSAGSLMLIKKRLLNDGKSFKEYPAWWLRYFCQVQNKPVNAVELISTHIYLQPSVRKSSTDSLIFFKR